MSYSRVTVIGANRRIDLVLPADQPVGAMTGDLIRLLDEPVASPPVHRYLVTTTGESLGGDTTLAAARILDGTVLRLVGDDDLPPAPVVYDVAEETAADRDTRPWTFVTAHRQTLAAAVLAVVALTASVVVQQANVLPGAPAFLAVVAGVAGVVVGRLGHRPLSSALLVVGALLGVQYVALAPSLGWPTWQRHVVAAAVVAATPAGFALAGRRPRGALLGSAIGVGHVLLWAAGVWSGAPLSRTAALLAVVSVAVLGVLPRAALTISGVASLDDRRTNARSITRRDVLTALSSAHEGLALAVVATAASAAVAGVVLAATPTVWTTPIGCLMAFVCWSRARSFPLTAQVVALVAAGVVVVVAFVHTWATAGMATPVGPLALLAVLAASATLTITLNPPDHTRARLRLILDRLEALAVIALIPLTAGAFGTYSRLLTLF